MDGAVRAGERAAVEVLERLREAHCSPCSRWPSLGLLLASSPAGSRRRPGSGGTRGSSRPCRRPASRRTSSPTATAACTPAPTRTRRATASGRGSSSGPRGGTLLRSWTVPGQDLAADHGVQVANPTPRGRLVLLEKSPAAVLTLDVTTGTFRRGRAPDLPTCAGGERPARRTSSTARRSRTTRPGVRAARCSSPTTAQAVIWKIPRRHARAPGVVRLAEQLDGTEFGTTGHRLPTGPARPADHPAVTATDGRCRPTASSTGCRSRRRRAARRRSRRCGPRCPATCPTASASAGPAGSTSRTPACPTSSSCCPRSGAELERFPDAAGHRRQRLAGPVRHPVQRDVPRHPGAGRQPVVHRRHRPPRDPRRRGRRAGAGAVPAEERVLALTLVVVDDDARRDGVLAVSVNAPGW